MKSVHFANTENKAANSYYICSAQFKHKSKWHV